MALATQQTHAPLPGTARGKARPALLKRLIDVVALPSTALSPQDRHMAADILLDMLLQSSDADRSLCARRLEQKHEAPRRLLRYLAQCDINISRGLLAENTGFNEADLCELVEATGPPHHHVIAQRKDVGPMVSERLVQAGNSDTIRVLLRNERAVLSEACVDALVLLCRDRSSLCRAVALRPEVAPSQALSMFWWADTETRRLLVMKHADNRAELISYCGDIFKVAATEGWSDPVVRKALQLIERRQRNRQAVDKSRFDDLEHAIRHAASSGMSAELAQEIGYLSGIKPVTIAKIMSDQGGEGLAVLAKATGLKRDCLRLLWTSLRRPLEEGGAAHPWFERVSRLYETMSVPRAQTTLRYWNWSISASLRQKQDTDSEAARFSPSQRTAALLFNS